MPGRRRRCRSSSRPTAAQHGAGAGDGSSRHAGAAGTVLPRSAHQRFDHGRESAPRHPPRRRRRDGRRRLESAQRCTSGAPDLFDRPDERQRSRIAAGGRRGRTARTPGCGLAARGAGRLLRPAGRAGRDFLVTATPGCRQDHLRAGAGHAAARAAGRSTASSWSRPTDHLRTQWAEAADAVRASPSTRRCPTRSARSAPDPHGYVTTYAQVAGKPTLHAARATARRTLVVLDEVHHAGDGLSWGEAVSEAFERRGPPAVPDRHPVPHPGRRADPVRPLHRTARATCASVADYSYGYREALRDGVVRPVVFAAYTGVSRWRNSAGEVIAASLTEAGTESTEPAAWRTALDPRGALGAARDRRDGRADRRQLRDAGMPDAAGLVLASDQDDARAYADIVERVTGRGAGADPVRRPEGQREDRRSSPRATSGSRCASGWCPRASTCRGRRAWPG